MNFKRERIMLVHKCYQSWSNQIADDSNPCIDPQYEVHSPGRKQTNGWMGILYLQDRLYAVAGRN